MVSLPSSQSFNQPWLQRGIVVAAALACTAVVVYYGWISDDALISMRYVRNVLEGHGPVYNLGDHVQGYTHPLWLLLLIPVHAVVGEPVVSVTVLGATLTLVALAYLGLASLRVQPSPATVVFFVLLAALLVSSEAWRSFQTSGLENSLSNLIIAVLLVELFRPAGPRVLATTLLCSLLVLSRPDLALLAGPLGAHMALRAVRERAVPQLLLGAAPVFLWAGFALLYYGTIVPNTANAKVGNASLSESVEQGIVYLRDWWNFEVGSVIALMLFLWVALRLTRLAEQRLFALGIALYFVYVIYIGGDFMRGRFFVPVLMGATCLTVLALMKASAAGLLSGWERWTAAAVLAGLAATNLFLPTLDTRRFNEGIVNERRFYEETSLRHYLAEGEVHYSVTDVSLVESLNRFADACGPFAVRSGTAGAFAYLSRLQVIVIDTAGLTDRYIASLDDSYLQPRQRVGHPSRRIPMSYLASRSDITIFEDWRRAVDQLDCGIIAATQRYATPNELNSASDQLPVYKPAASP